MSAVEGSISKQSTRSRVEEVFTRAKTGWRRFISFNPYTLEDRPDDGTGMTLEAIMQIGTGARVDELLTRREASVQVSQVETPKV